MKCLCECTPWALTRWRLTFARELYARLPELPYTPGNDGAGVVEQVGANVSNFKAGDRVYTAGSLSGTYAEFALCKKEQVHPLPANVSFAQGAAIGTPYATAYRGLVQRAGAKPGETVLVHGASGGVGTAAVQLARAHGLRVLGTAGSDEGLKLAREQGAHEVFDHRAPDHFEQVMKATGGHGVDVIVEMLANVNLGKDLTILAKGGRVVIIGSRGRVEINPRDTMQRDADVRGMILPNTPPAEMASIHAALVAGLENGTLRPVIGKEFPLADAAEAHRAVIEPGAIGKIVLVHEQYAIKEEKLIRNQEARKQTEAIANYFVFRQITSSLLRRSISASTLPLAA